MFDERCTAARRERTEAPADPGAAAGGPGLEPRPGPEALERARGGGRDLGGFGDLATGSWGQVRGPRYRSPEGSRAGGLGQVQRLETILGTVL